MWLLLKFSRVNPQALGHVKKVTYPDFYAIINALLKGILGSEVSLQKTTPRPRAALLMCLKKYSAIENSAIGNCVVLCSKLKLKQCY